MTVEVPFTQGKVAFIDDADADLVSSYKWYAVLSDRTWYARTTITAEGKRRGLYMHRLIMGQPLGLQVDHIDRDGLNNRRDNLRLATNAQNRTNQRINAKNTSGYRGVHWSKQAKKWMAQTEHLGKHIHFGCYDNPVDAAKAYDKGMRAIHGPHCHSNFPEEAT